MNEKPKVDLKHKCNKFLPKINIAYFLADHLIGRKHKQWHRLLIGTVILIVGATFVLVNNKSIEIKITTHALGTIIEGLGIVPYLELVLKEKNSINPEN